MSQRGFKETGENTRGGGEIDIGKIERDKQPIRIERDRLLYIGIGLWTK